MYCREKPTRLHLVRHAEVDEAYHEVFGGQIDMELSSLGHEQAKRLAKFLGGRTFDHIYISPMVRVRQTAEPLLDALGREAQVIDDLREVDFGVWTGHKWHEIQEKFGVDAEDWLLHLENGDVAEAETIDFISTPSMAVRKSPDQEVRRKSPSVTAFMPAASWDFTTSVISRSSTSRSAAASQSPCLCFSRASISSFGRRKLPT